jgi:cytochrome c peroxidase
LLLLALSACIEEPPLLSPTPYTWNLPDGVSPPPIPADNPLTEEKVVLGRLLFYETRLAVNQKRSCGICHENKLGYTDGFVRAVGATNEVHPRNTLSITNVGYRTALTWVEPELDSLEAQLLIPLLGTDPIVELGFGGAEDELLGILEEDAMYRRGFASAFPSERDPITVVNIARSIAAFERTMVSRDAPYDRYVRGDVDALSPDGQRGMELFFNPRVGCYRCHGGEEFMAVTNEAGEHVSDHGYFNIGLYDVDGLGSYPEGRTGLHSRTGEPADMGVVRVPTLRNVEASGPYFSDGTGATLEDVIEVFDAGGRETTSGPNVGDGRENPFKSSLLVPLGLTGDEKTDLTAFLRSLTDEIFLQDPRFSNPFPQD